MITRAEYINGTCNHRQYYSQFVGRYIKEIVIMVIGTNRLEKSTDKYFNDIPLGMWDKCGNIFKNAINQKVKDCGDYLTKAGLVCIAKEAARQILEEQKSS